MSDTNKAIALRSFEEIWNRRNLSIIDELYAAQYIGHITASAETIRGPEGLKRLAAVFQFAFPDICFAIEDQIAEGDKVASRWKVHGTQQRELLGLALKSELIQLTGISIQQISAGRIVESWDNWAVLNILQGLNRDVFQLLSVGI